MKNLTEKLGSKEMRMFFVAAIALVTLVAVMCAVKHMCKRKKCCNDICDEE